MRSSESRRATRSNCFFIDRFLDFRTHQRTSERLAKELTGLDEVLADALRAKRQVGKLREQEGVLERRLKTLDRQLENPAFTSYSRALEKMNTLKAATAQARSVVGIVAAAEDATGRVASPDLPQGLEGDVLVKRAMAALDVVRQMALDELVSGKEKLVTAVEDVAAEEEKYAPTLTAEKAKYEAMVAKAGGDYRALTAQRDALPTRLEVFATTSSEVKGEADSLRPTAELRSRKLEEYTSATNLHT